MTTENSLPTYKVIRVPRASPRLAELVAKSRTARLHALETDPTAFLSQHATESALPLSVWKKRLCDPEITVLACIAIYPTKPALTSSSNNTTSLLDDQTAPDDITLLLTSEWVGFAAVRGPMTYDDYYVTPDMGLPVPDYPDEEMRWHVFDLYTLPQHRGRGLARKLVGECVAVAVEGSSTLTPSALNEEPGGALNGSSALSSKLDGVELSGGEVKQARIRLFMNPKNPWLVTMYESLGFRAVGKVTLEEGFRANRLDESVPENTRENEELERVWHTRFGLAMERIESVSS